MSPRSYLEDQDKSLQDKSLLFDQSNLKASMENFQELER